MPLKAADTRTEPPVSVPMASGTTPAATATAAPDDEPPGAREPLSSARFTGVPKCGLRPRPEKANSGRLVLPMQIMPARVAWATSRASVCVATCFALTADAAVMTVPAISNRSFHATGTPSSGLKGAPLFQRAADCAASACARSGVRTMNASGTLVARSSAHSVTLTGWAQPRA
jgi:hypothetical protein